jgi:hypothetical protein
MELGGKEDGGRNQKPETSNFKLQTSNFKPEIKN